MGAPNTIESILARFIVEPETGCWIWQGAKTKAGYGEVHFKGKVCLVHRLTYAYFKGAIPKGLESDHLCRNRPCGHPDHLEPVTRKINVRRGEAPSAQYRVRTHCAKGHPFDEANTRMHKGSRRCRTCHRNNERERKNRDKKEGRAQEWLA